MESPNEDRKTQTGVCTIICEWEIGLSLAVRGSGEYETHPSAGLTNSRANMHLSVTLKSKSSKLSITAPEKKETPTEKTQKETQWTECSNVLTDLFGVHRAGETGWASQSEIMYKTRWHVGVVRSARALPVSVWVNTAVLLLQQLLWRGPRSPPCRAMAGWQAAWAHGQFQEL